MSESGIHKKVSPEQLLEIQELCKKDLRFLCKEILNTPDWSGVHDDIHAFLEKPSKRKLILVPRGHLKSHVVTKAFAIQSLLRDPNVRILIANQVWTKAKEMLSEIKQSLLDKTILPMAFGEFSTESRWNESEIVIRQRTKALSAPTIGTAGAEVEMTSTHYDIIILDDLQGLQNSATPEQREKVKRFYQSTLDLLEPGGLLIVVGTRWHLDDLYQHILDEEKEYYDVMVRRVIEDGKIIFPKKFNLNINKETKNWEHTDIPSFDYIDYLKKSKWDFSAQYMNDPTDDENQLFKKGYMKQYKDIPKGLFTVLTIDPAISEKQDADYTALVVTGMDSQHNIYVLDVVRGHWGPKDIINNVFATYLKWHPNIIALESIGFQRTLKWALEEEMRQRKKWFPIEEVKNASNVTKEFRIKALEPYYRGGSVFHTEGMKDLEMELQSFPRGKNDDMIDALSMSLQYLVPGSVYTKHEVPVGSWEHVANQARKSMSLTDFFTHG